MMMELDSRLLKWLMSLSWLSLKERKNDQDHNMYFVLLFTCM